MTSMGNAFVACGVIYCINEYRTNYTTINSTYDTKTGRQWDPKIQFTNRYGYNSMVDYNPREKVLYAWDSGHQVTYPLTFFEAKEEIRVQSLSVTKFNLSCCREDVFNGSIVPVVSAIMTFACALVAVLC